jgi:hypothetical protein
VHPSKKIKLFARYDKLMSNTVKGTEADRNLSDDGEMYLAGVEYEPVKGIKFAPNFQGWNPAGSGEPFSSSIFLNCEIKF